MAKKELSVKDQIVMDEMLQGYSVAEASRRTGFPLMTCYRAASKPQFKEELKRRQAIITDKAQIDAEYVLRQSAKLHQRCMQELKPSIEDHPSLGPDGEIEVDEDGNKVYIREVTFSFDSTGAARALDLLAKNKLVKAYDNTQIHEVNVDFVDVLEAARKRVEREK